MVDQLRQGGKEIRMKNCFRFEIRFSPGSTQLFGFYENLLGSFIELIALNTVLVIRGAQKL